MDSSQSNNKAQVKCIQAHNMDKQKTDVEKHNIAYKLMKLLRYIISQTIYDNN